MPCGGGDIGLNVWVENGDILVYMARSGSFDENNGLMKAGRLRIRLSPNPLEGGKIFKQELHLAEGYVTIEGAHKGVTIRTKIWVDVGNPVVHVELNSNRPVSATVAYENWRYQDQPLRKGEGFGNSWKWAVPQNAVIRKDHVTFEGQQVLFCHRNDPETVFDATVSDQGMEAVKEQLYNPLSGLIYGGLLTGRGLIPAGTGAGIYANTPFKSWLVKTAAPTRRFSFRVYFHTRQTESVETWKSELQNLVQLLEGTEEQAYEATRQWWQQFWQRSYIHTGNTVNDGPAWETGRNYQLFRYMLAAGGKGEWPLKFNGGLFTVDPVYTDTSKKFTPDFRNWGGGVHTMQNQRLVYFPMLKNGDRDLLKPQLDFYLRLLKNAELRSQVYWQHEGACFTEQMENYGLPNFAEYGQKRPDYFDKGLEYNAWLEYQWDTVLEFCLMMLEEHRYTGADITDKLPFIKSCLRFFDEHYQYRARLRGRRALDGDGKLVLYPGSAAETYKMATNATSTIAALQVVTERLLALPPAVLPQEARGQWEAFLKRIPAISFGQFDGKTTIAPARSWERINNVESPQLYPVYPWGLYGVGKPDLDIALNTWRLDTNVVRFRSHVGWKQDNIWAARLGLAEEAWKLTSLKLQNGERRFPAFWGPGFDWVPDHNWGGSGMIGLQEMLLQTDDRKIYLFPAWPPDQDVRFKLHAPYNTTVEAEWKAGKLIRLNVIPEERRADVIIHHTAAGHERE